MKNDKETMKAVSAVREKIKGKFFSDKISVSMHGGETITRKVGDTWIDSDGTEWEQKEGYHTNKTYLDEIKTPLFCPNCKMVMGGKESKFNTGCWTMYGHCFSCHLKEKKEMQLNGTWEMYEKKSNLEYNLAKMHDYKIDFEENKQKMLDKRVIENYDMKGNVLTPEVFDGVPKSQVDQIEKDINEYMGKLRKDIKKIDKKMKKMDKKKGI